MKKAISVATILLFDILCIFISIFIAVALKNWINQLFGNTSIHDYNDYTEFFLIYFIPIFIFTYQGIYSKRYDFWHESLLIIKSCTLSFVIIFSVLALSKDLSNSRLIMAMIFCIMIFIIPIVKFILKNSLFKMGIWQKKAKVINSDVKFRKELFKNHYTGYVLTRKDDYETIFISGHGLETNELNKLVESNTLAHKEVVFTPMLRGYDFSRACIFNFFNSQTNLFLIENSLLSPLNRYIKIAFDIIIVLCAMPFLLMVFLVVSVLIKLEEPSGKVFFSQKRLGQNGKEFDCYKFRSMREDGDKILERYLKENPKEIEFYEKYHKYENDPRITKIGKFLRKSSLDELPQLINILKFEMSIVGPRPFITGEREEAGVSKTNMQILLSVKPGMTGLAQVMGRGDTDFKIRTKMDLWYVKNWSIYNDIIIIIKTVKAVLKSEGAS